LAIKTQDKGAHTEHDLGLLVDEQLKFSLYTQTVAAKASQTLGIFKRTFSSHSPSVVSKLYKGLIQPKLRFGMCIANPINRSDQETLGSFQRRTTK